MAHQGAVLALAFGPDGKTVLTGSLDSTARLWDASTGRPLGPTMTHQNAVLAVAYSPDGKTVLTGSRDNAARLWDASTGRPLGPPMSHQQEVRAVAFSPDGKTVLTGSGKTARLWDVSELPDDPPRISTWVEVITGLGLDAQGSVSVLDNSTWRERRDKVETRGGPPKTGLRRSLAQRGNPEKEGREP
jgi:WD40 repeat protein